MLKNKKTYSLNFLKYFFLSIEITILFFSLIHFSLWLFFHVLALIHISQPAGNNRFFGYLLILIGDFVWFSFYKIWKASKNNSEVEKLNYYFMYVGVVIHVIIQIYFYNVSRLDEQRVYFSTYSFVLNSIFSGFLTCAYFIYFICKYRKNYKI